MKKIVMAMMVFFLIVGCSSRSGETQTLRVYNWGEYIDPDVISAFEDEYNVRVIYDLFASNEAMYIKLQDGSSYDVLVPSDYMIQRLREENLLQELDFSLIPNYDNIMDDLKNRHMDPANEYSVPYFWGNVGILYNQNEVDFADLELLGWNIFLDETYSGRLFFYDSERDAFMIALKALGYSANSSDPEELEEAYDWLVQMRQTMDPVYAADNSIDPMISGIKDLAVMYSGDATYIMSENEDMAFYVPKEGTNLWLDSMVIPANAQNVDMAHAWINYMISEEASAANSSYVGYTSPIESVIEEISGTDGDYEGIESYVPRTNYVNDEEFYYDAATKEIMSDYWQIIKAIQ